MKRKTAVRQNLEEVPVYIQDNSALSPDYFDISEFPTRLTAGKNLIKLRGNTNALKVGSAVKVEVLDYNGDPIYAEIISYIDEDKSRVVSIYIYEDTSPGDATIIIVGEAVNVPIEWQNKFNLRWTRTIPVNPIEPNVSEIIFEQNPTIVIREQVGVQLDRSYSISQFPQYSTGTIEYQYQNKTPIAILNGGKFISDMVGGTLTVTSPQNLSPTPLYNISNTTYTTTIKKILSDQTAILNTPYIGYSSQSLSQHTYTAFSPSSYTIDYEETPTYVPTENSESFALLEIKGLEPATGDVSRIKVYASGKGTVGTWELTNDIELSETEIFVPSTSSVDPYTSIGLFTSQSIIDTYWESHTYLGKTEVTAPTLTYTTESISNAVLISSSIDITNKNSVHVFQINDSFAGEFIQDSQYKIIFDAYAQKSNTSSNNNPEIYVYASGSAFNYNVTDYYNQELPVNLGKRIGELTVNANSSRIDDYEINFKADKSGNGVLIFVVNYGQWQLSDIRTTTDNDPGYTPNYTRIRTEIPTKHKSANQLAFKIEYYNVAGVRSKLISYNYDNTWQGGNRYIDGDYSMLTGSLYVADSLNSGVAISGYKNTGYVRSLGYDGFETGNPGFLLWSGSALQGQNTKGGVPYSGVGLELYADTDNYFRYSTADSELDVHTKTFFLGDSATQFISGSGGNLEISSSGFHLTADGNVTASSFIAVNGSDILFDSNNEFIDGLNVGRVVYFDDTEYSVSIAALPDNGTPTTTTGSAVAGPSFHMFILPGETRMQLSYTYEIDRTDATAGNKTFYLHSFIANSITGSYSGTPSKYGLFDSQSALGIGASIDFAPPTTLKSGANNRNITSSEIEDRQGYYVLVHTTLSVSNTTGATGTIKLKNFVFRTSRVVGSAISAPAEPVGPEI